LRQEIGSALQAFSLTTVTTTMILDVQVDCDESCFDLPVWGELRARDPNRHIFATPEWNRLWWEEFGEGKDLLFMTMRRREEVAAILPLYREAIEGRKVVRFIGGVELTDYLGPICAAVDRDEVAETLVSWLDETDVEWDEFDAHCLPVPFGFVESLVDHADRRSVDFKLDQEETTAVLELPPSWDAYLESLDSKERHELRRKRRRLARDLPDAVVRTTTAESLDADLKTFIDMHRGAEGHKGHFMGPAVATFFERVARAFMAKDWLRLNLLEVGGNAIASTFSFEEGHTHYLYNSAYERDAARYSPGFVLVSQLVKESINNDELKIIDFLRGPERYKFQLGAQAVPLNNVRWTRDERGEGL
jgi:CelD/BcsL family acetyltransferase involved in cellulose biosynthesis